MTFESKTLGELCTKITDGSHYSPKELAGGIPMYSVKDMTQFGFSDTTVKRISEDDYEALTKADCTPMINDVLIAKDGSVLKHVFSIESEVKGALLSSIAILRPNPNLVNSNFLAYALQDPVVRNDVLSNYVSGSGVPRIVLKDFKNISIKVPPLKKQIQIALLLKSLDRRIQNNTALCQTLEDIAQAYFKSWFIDFDPVRAKMAGEKPVGMDDETVSLFPDSLVSSERGSIPKEWATQALGDLITPKKGKTITKAQTVEGEVPVVAGGLQPAYYHNSANTHQPVVTISASGANAGFVRLYLRDIWASDCSFINQEVNQNVFFWYLFLISKQEQIYGMQQGAAQPHIYPSDLMRLKVCVPQRLDLISKFEGMVKPLFYEIGILGHQNQTLMSMRDSLLPRLISGELQIPEGMLGS